MTRQVLVVGGGIGGLAAALASARAGWEVRLFEQAAAFSEVGAGIQLGPNATRLLQAWGLRQALAEVASFPERLIIRRAQDGVQLGRARLGETSLARYGAPYATLHRADLHDLLLRAAWRHGVRLNLDAKFLAYTDKPEGVCVDFPDGRQVEGDALVGADGLWSRVREQALLDGPPTATGHLAYRALLPQTDLPLQMRSADVTVWMGPRLHVVSYPVRGGQALNLVVIVHGEPAEPLQDWDAAGLAADVQSALSGSCAELLALTQAAPDWGLWSLCDRPPLSDPVQMARGRVALLGDASHPMRPYLAQGAGMALEDAAELGQCLAGVRSPLMEVAPALGRYAQNRWQRNAQVQARAQRNGEIFHATGLTGAGRDWSLRLLGSRLLDQPWLYGYGQARRRA